MTKPVTEAFSVSDVLRALKEFVENEAELSDLWVRGEIGDLKLAGSGHCYFTLKDAAAALRCVMFRTAMYGAPRLNVGMQVYVHGRLTFYEQRGDLQLIADIIEDAGIGKLYQRFLAYKEELYTLGLLAPERKRPLPPMPGTIGVVTSPDAAALRDILRTLRLRWPLARVILAPTLVQGTGAAAQIAAAIHQLNAHREAEVIIIARGGGSMEDLWAFNEREVAEAILASAIPTVTGIGHETDFTIADFVADHRAATPTAAAIAACPPDITTFRAAIHGQQGRLEMMMQDYLERLREEVAIVQHRLMREHPRALYDRARQQVDELVEMMRATIAHRLNLEHERLSGAALRLQTLSPLLTIARGYGVITRDRDARPVTALADITVPEDVTIRLRDGQLRATVTAKAK